MICGCQYCAERRALNRNPEDLEELAKIASARELYRETGSITEVTKKLKVGRPVAKKWLAGLISEPTYIRQLGVNWPSFEEAKAIIRRDAPKSKRTDYQKAKAWRIKHNLPSTPATIYANQGWVGWEDYLGRPKTKGVKWPSFEQAKKLVREADITNQLDYAKKRKQLKLPFAPYKVYSAWLGWDDFLGKPRSKKIKWPSFGQAKALVQNEGITTQKDYGKAKAWRIKHNLPSSPRTVYADKGWVGWDDFFGKPRSWGKHKRPKKHLRRRNPDDLETLEKIAKARELYQETGRLVETARQVKAGHMTVRKWLADIEYIDPRIEQAKKIYAETGNIKETARQVSVGWRTVRKWVADLIPRKRTRKHKPDPRIEQAKKIYAETGNIKETARRVGASTKSVRKWVAGIKYVDPRIEQAKKIYAETGSITKTAKQVGVTFSTCRKWVKDVTPKKIDDPRIEQAKKIYAETGNLQETARRLGVVWRTARRWVKDLLPPREKPQHPKMQLAKKIFMETGNVSETARRVGVSRTTMHEWLSRRRNPDDLETLEKMVEARRLYQEGVSLRKISLKLFNSLAPNFFYAIRGWVEDLIPKRTESTFENIYEARRLRRQGWSKAEIIKKFKIGPLRLNQWLEGLDVEEEVEPIGTFWKALTSLTKKGYLKKEIAQLLAGRLQQQYKISTVSRWLSGKVTTVPVEARKAFVEIDKETPIKPYKSYMPQDSEIEDLEVILEALRMKGYKLTELADLLSQLIDCSKGTALSWLSGRSTPPLAGKYAIDELNRSLKPKQWVGWEGDYKSALRELIDKGYSKGELADMIADRLQCNIETARGWISKTRTQKPLEFQMAIVGLNEELEAKAWVTWEGDWEGAIESLLRKGYLRIELAELLCKKIDCHPRTARAWFGHARSRVPLPARKYIVELDNELGEKVDPRIELAEQIFKQSGNLLDVQEQLGVGLVVAQKLTKNVEYIDPRIEIAREIFKKTGSYRQAAIKVKADPKTIKEWVADIQWEGKPLTPEQELAKQLILECDERVLGRSGPNSRLVGEVVAEELGLPQAIPTGRIKSWRHKRRGKSVLFGDDDEPDWRGRCLTPEQKLAKKLITSRDKRVMGLKGPNNRLIGEVIAEEMNLSKPIGRKVIKYWRHGTENTPSILFGESAEEGVSQPSKRQYLRRRNPEHKPYAW